MAKETAAPARWSWLLLTCGLAMLVACEVASGVYAFQTANRAVLLGGVPIDAVMKIAASALPALAAFGGAWFFGWLRSRGTKEAAQQATLALIATAIAFLFAAWNFSSYLGWSRRMAEYPTIAKSEEYKAAVTAYANATARLSGEPMGYEEEGVVIAAQKRAAKIVATGQKPKGSELPELIDFLKALALQGLPMLMASAFQLPASVARQREKDKGGKPKGQRPKLAVNNT